jgi:hypothetical protein
MAKGLIRNEDGDFSLKRIIPIGVTIILSIVIIKQAWNSQMLTDTTYLYYALGVAISYQPKLIHDIFKIKGVNTDVL